MAALAARRLVRCRRILRPQRSLPLRRSKRDYSPREMLQNPIFYLLFLMMSLMSTSGLMVTSNVGPFAKEFGVADVLVFRHGGPALVA